KLFFNRRSSKDTSGWLSSENIKDLAEELGVKEETVIEREKRMCQGDASLDLSYTDDDGEQTSQQSLYLEDKSSNIEHQVVQQDY
ncbi:RNA polymerase sigma factor RpoH, partial [Francisella tularensis subsp. holarctica]|nr:RNA polymerase sigma factor RpoH [Francisella tularensis subsp. holarctica]